MMDYRLLKIRIFPITYFLTRQKRQTRLPIFLSTLKKKMSAEEKQCSIVELPYISCKNLAEVEHIRHYPQL